MRDAYHEALDAITDELVAMSRQVASMMQRASVALLEVDRERAEAVIEADEEVDSINQDIELSTTELIALQQPVATDLRMVVASMRISATLERMGDLAQHVAKTARMRYPDPAVPPELATTFREMAEVADRMAAKMAMVLASKDVELAREIENDDDRMDDLHRKLFTVMLDKDWKHGVETAVDISLVGRYYERYADHGVSVARRVVYLVTGEKYEDVLSRQE